MKPKQSIKTYSAFTFDFYYKGLGCKDPWRCTIQTQTGCPGAQRSELCRRWDTCARSGRTLAQTGPHSYRANLQQQHKQGLGARSFATTQDTQGLTEASLPSNKVPSVLSSHPSLSNAGARRHLQGAGREVCVLPPCSFYSAFSILPLNSLSLIPSAPSLLIFTYFLKLYFSVLIFFFKVCAFPAVQVGHEKKKSVKKHSNNKLSGISH